MNRQQCKDKLYSCQTCIFFWTKLYSDLFYAFARVENMKPNILKTQFSFLIDPMYENVFLSNKKCETLTLYIINNMEIKKLNEITNIIHLDNLSTYEDED